MAITEDKIKQILDSNDSNRKLLDMLAPLEIDRLVQLIADTINKEEQNQQVARQSITDAFEQSKDIFGNLNLSEILNVEDLVNQIYQSQT